MNWIIKLENLAKDFIFHHQQGMRIKVFEDFSMEFFPGEAAIFSGASGAGKSTLLRMIYATYKVGAGKILIKHNNHEVDIARADPATIYKVRKKTIGYVSQFLRVVPRISALDTVIEPLIERKIDKTLAMIKGKEILERLNIHESLWNLCATTFSGGEQQRINIARSFIAPYPIMLLDEPTASLDPENRSTVIELIREAVSCGSCVLGVFHSKKDQDSVNGRIIDIFPNNKGVQSPIAKGDKII